MKIATTLSEETRLHELARALGDAAQEYWKEYQQSVGSAAVVWVEYDDGRLVAFTRGEYARDIKAAISDLMD
jgi:hypothetical protein